MTPEEVESRVITPIEMEMLGISDQAILRSTAKYAIADITIDFVDGTDIYWARQQVAKRLSSVLPDLPASVSGGLAPISTPLSDIYMFTIEGPLSLQQKRELLDWTIRPALRTVPGVADVNVLGGFVRTFEVRPDPVALAAAGLSIADIQAAIESGYRNDGAGRLKSGEESLIVRALSARSKKPCSKQPSLSSCCSSCSLATGARRRLSPPPCRCCRSRALKANCSCRLRSPVFALAVSLATADA